MSLLKYIFYGFISGFSEFAPISAQAHQGLMRYLFGESHRNSVLDIFVHIGMIAALLISCRPLLARLRRDKVLTERSRRNRGKRVVFKGVYDLRIVRTASFPMIAGLLMYAVCHRLESNLVALSLLLVLNGILLLVPDHIPQGNKDSSAISGLDSVGIGIAGAFSAFPGISRIGTTVSYSLARGADRQSAYHWALLLSIPALILFTGFDALNLISAGLGTLTVEGAVYAFISCIAAFLGGYSAISLMRHLMVNTGFSGFGYYCFGAGIFSFIVYLIT